MGSVRLLPTVLLAVVLGLGASRASATTYYVDPATGADTNAGTLATAPWQTIPGTRTTDDSAYLRTAWGAITTTNKIACGDLILLKGGSTHSTTTVTNGGAWAIWPDYYTATCTAAAPITIRVATSAEWTGSSGPFTIDGTGITLTSKHFVPFGGSVCSSGGMCGLVDIESVNYVTVGGNSATQRLVVKNVVIPSGVSMGAVGVEVVGDGATTTAGVELGWFDVSNRTPLQGNIGAAIEFADIGQSILHDTTIHDWWGAGVDTGMSAVRQVRGLGVVNVTVTNSGPQSDPGGNFTNDCFNFAAAAFDDTQGGGGGVWCVNCTCANHYWNGSNSGGNDTPNIDAVVRYRNFQVYGAGRTASTNSARVGLESSGDANFSGNALPEQTIWLFDSIFYNNYNAGQGRPHGAGSSFMWNTTMFRAGTNGSMIYDVCEDTGAVYDSIIDSGTAGPMPYYINNCGSSNTQNNFVPWSQNTLYIGTSTSQPFALPGSRCTSNTTKKCRLQSDCLSGEGICQAYSTVLYTWQMPSPARQSLCNRHFLAVLSVQREPG